MKGLIFLEFYGILSVSLLIKPLNGCSPLPGIHLLLLNFLQLFLKKIDCIHTNTKNHTNQP